MLNITTFIAISSNPRVLKRSLTIACIVGTLLGLINHGDSLFSGSISALQVMQLLLNYLVPFAVSSYTSAKMIVDGRDFNEPRW